MHPQGGTRTWAGLVFALVLAATTGFACSESSDLPEKRSPQPELATSPTPADPEQQAIAEITEVLDLFVATFIHEASEGIDPDSEDSQLRGYGDGGQGLGVSTRQLQFASGYVGSGTITWEFVDSVEFDLEGRGNPENMPTVSLLACFDESEWVVVNHETGEVVDVMSSRGRYQEMVTAWFAPDESRPTRPAEAWRVTWTGGAQEPCPW